MRKILICAIFILGLVLSINSCLALTQEEANAQIGALRAIKKTEKGILNKQIEEKTDRITKMYISNEFTDSEKEQQIKLIQSELNELYRKKSDLDKKYNKDKKAIKKQIK